MFINFWYAAGMAKEFTDKPLKRRMLGQDFVMFRDGDGIARVLANTCVHRGGSLAGGKLKGNCVQCPYHGWEFDGEGRCHRIPSLGPDAKIPARARVDAYPTVERYGLVFAFLGDLPEGERPPIMDVPEYPQSGVIDGWRATLQHYEFDFEYKRSMENGIDPAHNEFVHPTHGFSGENPNYRVPEINWEANDWGGGFWTNPVAPPLAEKKMREASGREEDAVIEAGTGHFGPTSLWTYIHPTPDIQIHQYVFETPVDSTTTGFYLLNLRNFVLEPENDERMITRNEVVAFQDRDVLEGLLPRRTPETRIKELFLPADHPIARYRDRCKEWEARGWRIDTDEVERNQRRVAYAIPSPARRTQKGWVLDAVPMMPAEAAEAAQAEAASGNS